MTRLVRERERYRITGVPKSTCYLLMRQGRFPKPVPLTDQTVGWVESELYAWNAAQIAKRDQEAGAA